MTRKTLPTITIECNSTTGGPTRSSFTADWRDETYRYHVWIHGMEIGDTLHRNLIEDRTPEGWLKPHRVTHKALDLNAAAHAPILAEIRRIATREVLAHAYEALRTAEREKEGMERRERADNLRHALFGEADRLQLEGAGQVAQSLRRVVNDMLDFQLLRTANAIRNI